MDETTTDANRPSNGPRKAMRLVTRVAPLEMQDITEVAKDGRSPWERHREIEAHREEIKADILNLGRKATRRKWNMGFGSMNRIVSSWFTPEERLLIPGYTETLKGEHKMEPEPINPVPVEMTIAASESAPRLPHFNEAWSPEVQMEWLRAYRAQLEVVYVTVLGG